MRPSPAARALVPGAMSKLVAYQRFQDFQLLELLHTLRLQQRDAFLSLPLCLRFLATAQLWVGGGMSQDRHSGDHSTRHRDALALGIAILSVYNLLPQEVRERDPRLTLPLKLSSRFSAGWSLRGIILLACERGQASPDRDSQACRRPAAAGG